MMAAHRIDVADEAFCGTIFSTARHLLAQGIAKPDDFIETYRGQTMCLRGPVWAAAKLAVQEGNNGRPRMVLWEAFKTPVPASPVR